MSKSQNKQMASVQPKSDIEIEIATRPALRLWNGRVKTDKKHGILGIPGFCKILKGIEQAIKDDDPYADYHYHATEQAITALKFDLDSQLKDMDEYIKDNVPPTMRLPDVGNKEPEIVPIRFASRLGFKLVYQLLTLDQVVLKVLLANHIGILNNSDKFDIIGKTEKRFRGVINTVFNYTHTGVTRDDMAANNQRAQKAKSIMGEIEKGYLEGTERSDNAPSLPPVRLKTLGKVLDISKVGKKEKESIDEEVLGEALEEVLETMPSSKSAPRKKRLARPRKSA